MGAKDESKDGSRARGSGSCEEEAPTFYPSDEDLLRRLELARLSARRALGVITHERVNTTSGTDPGSEG